MFKQNVVLVALSGLLLTSPLVMAVDEHHPEKVAEVTQDARSMEKASGDAAVAPSGMMKPGMMSGGQSAESQSGTMMGRPGMMGSGMMKGGPGMMGNRSGMMQGGSGMMGQGGMMSQGMKGGHGKRMMGHGMMRKHQQVVNRLDLIDARMAKIEVMLERLMQR